MVWQGIAGAVVVLSTVFSGLSTAPALAATGGSITGVGSKCLTNKGAAITANNPQQLSTCVSGAASQQYSWTGDATIRTKSHCLDTKSSATAAGTAVVINTCSTATSQQWTLQANGTIKNVKSSLCVMDKGSVTTNGNPIILAACGTAKGQIWNISKAVVALPQTAPAVHAALPTGTRHTAAPTITLNTTAAPEFAPWLQNQIKPLLQQWYPVLGDYYAYPDYKPAASFTITVDPTYSGVAYTSGSSIVLSASYYRAHLADAGSIVHEAVHVVQANPSAGVANLPSWLAEGEADYGRDYLYGDHTAMPPTATQTYLDGYEPAAVLLDYARAHSTLASFVHSINVVAWKGTYSDNFWQQNTGISLAQLWTNLTGQIITNPGPITNGISGKCFDLPYYATADGTRIQIQTCNGLDAEKWVFAGTAGSATTGEVKGFTGNKCLDVSGSGSADGTAVQYYTCNSSAAQQWTRQANGSLVNVNSGKCLQPVGGANTDGTLLEIATCNGSTAQKWTLPATSQPRV